jgi:predicted nucleic acid-binding protein
MTCYVDTSVWLALLGSEATAHEVSAWMSQGMTMVTAQWTGVEIASGLGIKARRGELTQATVSSICESFRQLVAMDGVYLPGCEDTDFQEAATLCEGVSTGLHGGDALHLVVAQRAGCTHFLSFDKVLNRQAQRAGFALVAI